MHELLLHRGRIRESLSALSDKPCEECLSAHVEWRPVPDPRFFDKYEISNLGECRSVDRLVTDRLGRTRSIKGTSKYMYVCKFGYCRYALNYGGRHVKASVAAHRLVAVAFIGPPPGDGYEVMHLDHDPGHNHVSNLRWGTHSENVLSTVDAGRYVSANSLKTHCPYGHEYTRRNNRGDRVCGQCDRERQAARKRLRRERAGAIR